MKIDNRKIFEKIKKEQVKYQLEVSVQHRSTERSHIAFLLVQMDKKYQTIRELKEGLEHYESAHYCTRGYRCDHDKTATNLLKKLKEELE